MKPFASLSRSRFLSLLAAATLSAAAQAEIYKTVDEHGNVSYSDKGDGDQTAIELKPANSLPAVVTPPAEEPMTEEGEQPVKYKRLKITSPADDSAIEHGPGDFTVDVSITPALAQSHRMQLFIDGAAHSKPAHRTSFDLKNVFRGTHTLQVKVLNADGKVIKRSKTSTVHVFRPSVLLPGSRR